MSDIPESFTPYGIIHGEWHVVHFVRVPTPTGEDTETRSICKASLRATSVMTYLGGDLCPECREIVTRSIVEDE